MNPVANQVTFPPIFHGAFAGGRSCQAEQVSTGSVSLNHSMDLTITTDEGDTVSLSMASTMQTEAGIYRSDADVDGHLNESASFNLI